MEDIKGRKEALMYEYEIMRNEALDALRLQNAVVSFGLATVGVLFGGALTLLSTSFSSAITAQNSEAIGLATRWILCILIPVVTLSILSIWFGEIKRLIRIGNYLYEIEETLEWELRDLKKPSPSALDQEYINNKEKFDRVAFQWQHWMQENRNRLRFPYIIILFLFLGISITTPFTWFILNKEWLFAGQYSAFFIVPCVTTLVLALILFLQGRQLQ
jgi:hypothetical protein